MKEFKTTLKISRIVYKIKLSLLIVIPMAFMITSSSLCYDGKCESFPMLTVDVEQGENIFEGTFTVNNNNYKFDIRKTRFYKTAYSILDLYEKFIPRGIGGD